MWGFEPTRHPKFHIISHVFTIFLDQFTKLPTKDYTRSIASVFSNLYEHKEVFKLETDT